MSKSIIHNVQIKSVSACVPKKTVSTADKRFKQLVGVWERRIADKDVCTSDLCFHAAEELVESVQIERKDIGIVVFVSQTSDYKLPVTSAILQHKLGLPTTSICFDVPLGCSGYTYGLYIVASMMKSSGAKYGLLLAGDTITKEVNPEDKSTNQLFGDAGTATLLEYSADLQTSMVFDLGTDGSGFESIIIPHGGSRNPINDDSLVESCENGNTRRPCDLHLNGPEVYTFGTERVSSLIKDFLKKESCVTDIDYVLLHQANKMMNDKIVREIGFAPEQAVNSLQHFGNTSSATIPLTIVTQLAGKHYNRLLLSGFGVGLSWGNILLNQSNIHSCKLIEL